MAALFDRAVLRKSYHELPMPPDGDSNRFQLFSNPSQGTHLL
jgi:hypothetical protein